MQHMNEHDDTVPLDNHLFRNWLSAARRRQTQPVAHTQGQCMLSLVVLPSDSVVAW